jgi:hypothetical protein
VAIMKELVEFPLEGDSGSVFVEVDVADHPNTYTRVATRPGELAGRASQTFQEALESMRPAVGAVLNKFTSLAVPPDEVQLEFSVKLTGKAGAVLAATSAEGQFKVLVTWQRSFDRSARRANSPAAGEPDNPGLAPDDESAGDGPA